MSGPTRTDIRITNSKLTGKRVLIDYIFVNENGLFDHAEQTHGVITAVSSHGVIVLEHGTTNRLSLPADFPAYKRAKKGNYQLITTGEMVHSPDYITEWVGEAGETPTASNLAARRACSAYSYYGIGTSIYGNSERNADGSYIATKWLTIFMLPILPLASFRMYGSKAAAALGNAAPARRWSVPVPLNKAQVSNTYFKTYATLFLVLVGLRLLGLMLPVASY